jgi:hypothetical protein
MGEFMLCYRNQVFAAAMMSLAMLAPIDLAYAADIEPTPAKAVPFISLPFFIVNDNRLTYAFEFDGKAAGYPGVTAKQVVAFTHFDAWAYGTNAINVGMLKSDQINPAAPCLLPNSGCAGATEFYGVIRSTFGFNEIFNTKAFSIGPLRNVSFEVGAGEGIKNDLSAIDAKAVVAGLQFAFDLPYKGYFNVSPMVYKAWYYTSFVTPAFVEPFGPGIPNGELSLNPTWTIEANYYMDLGFLPEALPLAISGHASWIGGMGALASPSLLPSALFPPTKAEINSEPIRLTLDAGKVFWGPKYSHFADVWVAYKYRQNILGLDHALTPACAGNSCTVSTVYSGLTVKF